jgi:hypothetical protein
MEHRRAIQWKSNNVSEEHVISRFKFEGTGTKNSDAGFLPSFLVSPENGAERLVRDLGWLLTTTRRYILEDRNLFVHLQRVLIDLTKLTISGKLHNIRRFYFLSSYISQLHLEKHRPNPRKNTRLQSSTKRTKGQTSKEMERSVQIEIWIGTGQRTKAI